MLAHSAAGKKLDNSTLITVKLVGIKGKENVTITELTMAVND